MPAGPAALYQDSLHLIPCARRRRRTAWCGSRRRRSRTTCWACCVMLRANWTAVKRSSTGGWSTGALRPGHRCGGKILFFAAPAGAMGRQGMCAEQAQRGWRLQLWANVLTWSDLAHALAVCAGISSQHPSHSGQQNHKGLALTRLPTLPSPNAHPRSRPRTGWHTAGTRWWWTRWRSGSGRSAWPNRRGDGGKGSAFPSF